MEPLPALRFAPSDVFLIVIHFHLFFIFLLRLPDLAILPIMSNSVETRVVRQLDRQRTHGPANADRLWERPLPTVPRAFHRAVGPL